VEAALDSEDVLPLVRVVFESKKLVVEQPWPSPGATPPEATPSRSSSFNRRPTHGDDSSRPPTSGLGPGSSGSWLDGGDTAAVMDALRHIVDGQEVEIEKLCRMHYADIARCSEDIAGMVHPVARIKETLFENNRALQQAGSGLLGRLQEVQELSTVRDRIADAKSVAESCTVALELCSRAWAAVEGKQLYRALNTAKHVSALVSTATEGSRRQAEAGGTVELTGALTAGAVGKKGPAADLRLLKPFVANQALEITSRVEQRVQEDFKQWLVDVRRMAASIGRKAIRKAAHQRQTEDEVMAESRAIQAALNDCRNPREAAARCLGVGGGDDPEEGDEEDGGGLLDGLNMAPVYSCHHIYRTLDRTSWFQSTYLDNRRQQMMTDLTLSQPFVDVYQSYLNQVVGFFLIEDRVLRTSDGITSPSAVDALWETALSQIKVALEGAYERLGDPNALLLVKDFVHLVCRALAACTFHVTPIEEVLTNGRNRYHELLLQNAAQEFLVVISGDDLKSKMAVKTEQERVQLLEAGLPLDLAATPAVASSTSGGRVGTGASGQESGQADPDGGQQGPENRPLPFTVPFTPMVPKLIQVARRFITDSTAYLRGIMGPGELLPVVRQFRDRLVSKVLCEQFVARIATGSLPVNATMQLVANVWAINCSITALDDYTVEHGRLSRASRRGSTGPASRYYSTRSTGSRSHVSVVEVAASLEALQKAAESHTAAELARQLDYILGSVATSVNWMPESSPRLDGCSDYMEKAIIYLQKYLQLVMELLPSKTARKLQKETIGHFAKSLTQKLQGDAILRYNIHAVQRLDADLMAVEDYAMCLSVSADCDLASEFSALRAIVKLLLSNEVEKLLEEGLQSRSYAALMSSSPQMLVAADILDKYREASSALLSRGAKQPAEAPRRRDIDKLVKYLRETASGSRP